MEIKDVKKIIYNNGVVEILLDIKLDNETTNRWELEGPNALVFYKFYGELEFDHVELIDRGMKIHGYEFTEEEESEICNFLDEKVLKNNIFYK